MQWRWLTWLVLPLTVGGALWVSQPHSTEWAAQTDGRPCKDQPFALESQQAPNTVENGNVLLAVNGAYVGAICAPGVLTYQARGDQGQGRGPRLVVSSADRTLFSGELTKENRAYRFTVPPGPVAFVFEDDYAGAEGDRNVWLSDVTVAMR